MDNEVFARIMVGLATKDTDPKTIMIDATYLRAHRRQGEMPRHGGTPRSAKA